MIPYGPAPPLAPALSSTVVALAIERLTQAGFDPEPLLRQAGLADDPIRGDAAECRSAFLNTAAEVLHDRSLGLHLAQGYDLRRLGLFFYLMASSETVGEALNCFERFARTDGSGLQASFRMSDVALTVVVGLQDPVHKPDRHFSEFRLLSIYRLVTSLAPATPLGVSFTHERHEAAEETESRFAIPVEFDASEDRIAFAVGLAEARLPSFDPYLHESLVRYFEHAEEATRREPDLLWSQVKKAMAPRLSQGTATTAEIARDLGMSTRTLSRRLHQEGKTFSGVLDELRAELAIHYIKIKGLPISEIAWLLGYREASALVVAFRRWTGMSPTELRRRYDVAPVPAGRRGPREPPGGRLH